MNQYGFVDLTSDEVHTKLTEDSILCLPIGATEQHGLHLPLCADTLLAREFANKIVSKYHDKYQLWMLPALDYSLSTEHKWASGSITLSVELFSSLLHTIVRELAETQPARNLIIVNGHGGNRGVLETLILEFRARYEIVSVILHPSALSSVKSNSNLFEVHGGKSETSLIMAFTPMFVRNDKIPDAFEKEVQNNVKQLVLDRAVSWPWNSNDLGLGVNGIIGDPANATIELGNAIIDSAVDNAEEAIKHLVLFGKAIRSNKGGNLNGSE